jgi:hypothetical protein
LPQPPKDEILVAEVFLINLDEVSRWALIFVVEARQRVLVPGTCVPARKHPEG